MPLPDWISWSMNSASSGEKAAQKPGDLESAEFSNSTMISRRARPSPQVSTAPDCRRIAAMRRCRLVGSIVLLWNRAGWDRRNWGATLLEGAGEIRHAEACPTEDN